jgi:alpha-L-fucosidase
MASPQLRKLCSRETPAWWREARLGIFVHWTPASVPGWAPTELTLREVLTSRDPRPYAWMPYTEWYENSLRLPGSPVWRFHRESFGDRPYEAFGDDFNAALARWDPRGWARAFARSGARYAVLVAKHHDGFCLWPSGAANPNRPSWHATRDVVGELAAAVRAEGMRFGIYYSGGLDWTFDDRPIATTADAALAVPRGRYAEYAAQQLGELVERYSPSVLWNDIAWPQGGEELWKLLRSYYEKVPDGVVNDRWLPRPPLTGLLRLGAVRRLADVALRRSAGRNDGLLPPKPPHFDFRTPEYAVLERTPPWPWECVRGMDRSFGYNRNSRPEHFISRDELVDMLSAVNSRGGNLMLNVGPRGTGQYHRCSWSGSPGWARWRAATRPLEASLPALVASSRRCLDRRARPVDGLVDHLDEPRVERAVELSCEGGSGCLDGVEVLGAQVQPALAH